MKIKVLGSVSPYCYENKCGIGFLVSDGKDKILLDAGSGISKNMKLPEDLNNLTIIISHLHRDHFVELLPLSYASYVYNKNGLLKNKIKVYYPNDKDNEVKRYIESLWDDSLFDLIEYDENTILNIGNMHISFRSTVHGVKTYSIKVECDNKRLVYSSDTGFSNKGILYFAREADLFICETTYLKSQKKNKDVHLTTIEAGTIAKEAFVKKMMINHFWPNIDKRLYLNETKFIFNNTILAEENEEFEI